MPPPGEMLKAFYRKWYAPGNAILVIVGDVDPPATMAAVEQAFGAIPNHPVPPRPAVNLQPVSSETFTLDSNLPYALGFIAFRFPGTSAADYAAAQVLADVLSSQRGDLYGMVPAGKALAAEFGLAETYPQASVGYGLVALPAGGDISSAIRGHAQDPAALRATGRPARAVRGGQTRRAGRGGISAQLDPGTRQSVVGGSGGRGPGFSG